MKVEIKMKVAVITPWFSEGMGYAENILPFELANQGCEVTVISGNINVYFGTDRYAKVYEKILGPGVVPVGEKRIGNFNLVRLNHSLRKGKICLQNLKETLEALQPDIVQLFELDGEILYIASDYCNKHCKKLFTECHVHESTFSGTFVEKLKLSARKIFYKFSSKHRLATKETRLVYCIAPDVLKIARKLYLSEAGKCKILPLGVNTNLFRPASSQEDFLERVSKRSELGLQDFEIACVYTGRFTEDKAPQVLAQAVSILRAKNLPFKAFFAGAGTDEHKQHLNSFEGCKVLAFENQEGLAKLYRAIDVGVWPREESTSQLDCLASGKPLILSNRVLAEERTLDSAFQYEELNPQDLAINLEKLTSGSLREKMGKVGSKRILESFSWQKIAADRVKDYENL
jgi:glycosyltransferase involved in cell wall biosynthesis